VFREAVRVPRHAFSPNSTGALGTPLDFRVKLGLRFYLEVLVFWVKVDAKCCAQIDSTAGQCYLQPLFI